MNGKYILKGHKAVLCHDLIEWARWFEDGSNRRVAADDVNGIHISTVFLGLDHRWDNGPPMLFETMTFGKGFEQEQERYSTWDEAMEGHAKMIERVKAAIPASA